MDGYAEIDAFRTRPVFSDNMCKTPLRFREQRRLSSRTRCTSCLEIKTVYSADKRFSGNVFVLEENMVNQQIVSPVLKLMGLEMGIANVQGIDRCDVLVAGMERAFIPVPLVFFPYWGNG